MDARLALGRVQRGKNVPEGNVVSGAELRARLEDVLGQVLQQLARPEGNLASGVADFRRLVQTEGQFETVTGDGLSCLLGRNSRRKRWNVCHLASGRDPRYL